MTDSALAELWGCQGWFNWAELNLSQETNRDCEGKGENLCRWSIKPIRPFDLDHTAYFAEIAAITLLFRCVLICLRTEGSGGNLPPLSDQLTYGPFISVKCGNFFFRLSSCVMSCCLKQQLERETRVKVMLRFRVAILFFFFCALYSYSVLQLQKNSHGSILRCWYHLQIDVMWSKPFAFGSVLLHQSSFDISLPIW